MIRNFSESGIPVGQMHPKVFLPKSVLSYTFSPVKMQRLNLFNGNHSLLFPGHSKFISLNSSFVIFTLSLSACS